MSVYHLVGVGPTAQVSSRKDLKEAGGIAARLSVGNVENSRA